MRRYKINNGGHNWPGGPLGNGNGTVSYDIDATVIMITAFGLD